MLKLSEKWLKYFKCYCSSAEVIMLFVYMKFRFSLGYDCKDRKLVINEQEASVVKFIYEQFQVMESCMAVSDALNRNGYRTKLRAHTNGRNAGNKLYSPKDVRRILTNPCYKGYVTHKENVYHGEHTAIIDEPVWDYAQTLFKKYNQDALKGLIPPHL